MDCGEERGGGRAGGSMTDLWRGRSFLGGNKETLCKGKRDEICSHALCLSSVCIRIYIISSAAHNLLKVDPLFSPKGYSIFQTQKINDIWLPR